MKRFVGAIGAVSLLTLGLAGGLAGAAQAHAKLLQSTPAAGATVAAPATLHLAFSEKLEPKFSSASLAKADGSPVTVKSVADGKAIDVRPAGPLAGGAYKVMWQALSADGHKTAGDYSFTVK